MSAVDRDLFLDRILECLEITREEWAAFVASPENQAYQAAKLAHDQAREAFIARARERAAQLGAELGLPEGTTVALDVTPIIVPPN